MPNIAGNLTALSLLLSACGGGPEVCYLEKASISVSGDLGQTTCKDLEDEVEAFRRAFDNQTDFDPRFSNAFDHIKGIEIHMRGAAWACSTEELGSCIAGQAYCFAQPRHVELSNEYPRSGVLVHELVHIAQDCIAWPLEQADHYPGSKRTEYGHEGWTNHRIWSQLDYARSLLQ
jgi:hypothetical protein